MRRRQAKKHTDIILAHALINLLPAVPGTRDYVQIMPSRDFMSTIMTSFMQPFAVLLERLISSLKHNRIPDTRFQQ